MTVKRSTLRNIVQGIFGNDEIRIIYSFRNKIEYIGYRLIGILPAEVIKSPVGLNISDDIIGLGPERWIVESNECRKSNRGCREERSE